MTVHAGDRYYSLSFLSVPSLESTWNFHSDAAHNLLVQSGFSSSTVSQWVLRFVCSLQVPAGLPLLGRELTAFHPESQRAHDTG